MSKIEFPAHFPTIEDMKNILHKTIQQSWGININNKDIELWLENFEGKCLDSNDEKRMMLWLLCNFTFFSVEEVNHLCKILYNKLINDIMKKENISLNLSSEEVGLKLDELIKQTMFAAIGSASESGGMILYNFRQQAELSIDKFFYPTAFESNKDNILVFIDDVTLSGGTGLRNFYDNIIEQEHKSIYYLTIIASKHAIDKLEEKGINVLYCNLVDDRNQCFTERSMIFNKFPSIRLAAEQVAKFYGELIKDTKVKSLGYKNGAYAFGFYYNIPNNTLPIFWSTKNWYPIFVRREKLQNDKQTPTTKPKYI